MSCIVYMVSCNFATHVTCPLVFTTYKYNDLQISFATQKLNCKDSCKTFFFPIVIVIYLMFYNIIVATLALGSRPRQRELQGCGPRGSPGVKPRGSPGVKPRGSRESRQKEVQESHHILSGV
jgi:hypothetical protein